ncbi:hypothetical protein DM860_016408 [Cuscuta australis]|uniref:PDZ domain-containing protein n=2 Tax=Cuscuta sect. Cleistogrammica TaxID=1824901 RepID=A0A328DE38_9ASTE|nr:hypothetical protein DM860_016408 [Cuscuta australis]
MEGHECLSGHGPDSADCGKFRDRKLLVRSVILKACGSVVSVVTYDLPDDMLKRRGSRLMVPCYSSKEPIFWGSGIVIECESNASGTYYLTVLTTTMIFKRTNNLQPGDVVVDVGLPDGEELEARVICYDFHYNLVALKVESSCAMPVANMKLVDDVLPMDPEELLPHSFQLRPHSDRVKLVPGELVIGLGRHYRGDLINAVGFYSPDPTGEECTELYGAYFCNHILDDGGPLINRMGQVIGIKFHTRGHPYTTFLPTNIILKWWSHYKKFGDVRRPWLGTNVFNLHGAMLDLLLKFPNITTGVIVIEVSEDSPAHLAGLQCNDVIVQCDGSPVRSILEFFERTWDKVGESVELEIVRAGMSHPLKRVVQVQEASPDKYYRWLLPEWFTKEPRVYEDEDEDEGEGEDGEEKGDMEE